MNGKIRILNDLIISFNLMLINIYDLFLNFRASIHIDHEIVDVINDRKQDDMIFFKTIKNEILIFSLLSYSIIGSINSSFDFIEKSKETIIEGKKILNEKPDHKFRILNNNLVNKMINKMVISRNQKTQACFFYKIDFKKSKISNSKYLCKLNPIKTHLYLNAYLLPCGNSACLNCIYKNYNIYEGWFQCNFDSCKKIHKLTNKLTKNSQIDKIIEENFHEIFNVMNESVKNNLNENGKYRFKNTKIFGF